MTFQERCKHYPGRCKTISGEVRPPPPPTHTSRQNPAMQTLVIFSILYLLDVTYELCLKMGDVQGDGTEGSVSVELIGSNGKTERIVLREANDSRIKFEKGKSYKFTIETADIGLVSWDTFHNNICKQSFKFQYALPGLRIIILLGRINAWPSQKLVGRLSIFPGQWTK